uniref:Uncharacterized protein n=1 Tax=Anopheles darlingi TaxID=43151 RepID=A0A2M4CY05_ANODA
MLRVVITLCLINECENIVYRFVCVCVCGCVYACNVMFLCVFVCMDGCIFRIFSHNMVLFCFFCCFNPSSIGISIWVLAAACLLQLCVISLSPLLAFTHESTVFRAAAGNIALSKRYPCSSRFLMLCFLPLIPPARTCPICCCSFICLIIS